MLSARTVANAIPRPAWWFNFLTTEPLAFASLDSWSGTVAELASALLSGYLRAIVGSDRVEHALASVLIQGTIPTPDEFDALRRLTKAVGSVPEFDDEEPVPVPY